MTQEQADKYNKWVAAYNRVVYAENNLIKAYNCIVGAKNGLVYSYTVNGSLNDNNMLSRLMEDIMSEYKKFHNVVLPYIDNEMKKIRNS